MESGMKRERQMRRGADLKSKRQGKKGKSERQKGHHEQEAVKAE